MCDLQPDDSNLIEQVAALLMEGFREHEPDAWPTMADALAEVRASFEPGRLSRVARDESGAALGWIGAISQYDGLVWEIHPLVVLPACQGRGVGRALVLDVERLAAERGALTLQLGTDDTDGRTSLAGVDLYPDVWTHIAAITNPGHHPYEFYQKLGFVITGVVPDANGPGKPDILMAKRVARQ